MTGDTSYGRTPKHALSAFCTGGANYNGAAVTGLQWTVIAWAALSGSELKPQSSLCKGGRTPALQGHLWSPLISLALDRCWVLLHLGADGYKFRYVSEVVSSK